jgi:cytochrome c-type biogenesis protein CcmH/NrfG
MEVAVKVPVNVRHLVRFASLALSLTLVAALVGCSDTLTYSKDSDRRGQELYAQQSWAEAAGAYRNSTRQNPRDFKAYYMLGNCYTQMGQWQKAINAYRTSLDVQQVTLEGKYDHQQRANTIVALAGAIARSDTRDVETNAAVAKARANQSPDDYLLLAKVYAFRGDADSALESFEHAAQLAPENFYVSKEYGLYLVQLGQNKRAESALRHAYALNQGDEQVNLALRRIGVVPGPSLKSERDLAGPPVPKGPIPEMSWGGKQSGTTTSAPPASNGQTVQAPRD